MFSELLRTLAKLFNSLLVFSEEVMGGREGGRGGRYSNRVRRLSRGCGVRPTKKFDKSYCASGWEGGGGGGRGRGGSYSNRVRRLSGGGSLDRTFSGMGGWRWVYDFVLVCV